ncbi:hypothetical protein PFISCL1PPCAC_10180 [Pristionchus fissidentatus]|uniref:Ig-like domain-containing protein n=1 Tax=Pristionchus fissidentatus TaxID=1538716 RepID=A0AAV5VKQ5_9BILA|nr:hypothetical protein PFISCL1PPCAC_10180 [Pristionchus fissidentatus]
MIYLVCLILFLPGITSITQEELECINQERAPVENPHKKIITVIENHPAYLHCVIPNGSNHIVAWSRAKDRAYLTAGTFVFFDQDTMQVSKKNDQDWVLILRTARRHHSGCYLCEANTDPDTIIYPVYLHVVEAASTTSVSRTRDEGKLMANMDGGEVVLNCTLSVDDSVKDEDIQWTRSGLPLNLTNTQKYVLKTKRSSDVLVHTMRIRAADADDDGNYACFLPSKRDSRASQIVHVNTKSAPYFSSSASSTLLLSLISLLILQFSH